MIHQENSHCDLTKAKIVTRAKERYCDGKIVNLPETYMITIINIQAPNNRATKYLKKQKVKNKENRREKLDNVIITEISMYYFNKVN